MSLLKLADGRVVAVPAYDEVTTEDLRARRDKLAAELADLDALLGAVPEPVKPSTPPENPESGAETPQPTNDGAVVPPVTPSGQPAMAVQPQVTPLAGTLPQTETPVAPVAPTSDPIQ